VTSAAAALAAALAHDLPRDAKAIGVAVSGGSDSLGLMVLLADWARLSGTCIRVATVDHGLRPAAAAEAALVARHAARLGLEHDVLTWRDWDGRGNLQAMARAARFALLRDWAALHGLTHVCLGHTLDDQAETVLLRLARGSGVDGLSAMARARRDPDGPVWLRPLLGARRTDLRALLQQRGFGWIDDPSNTDLRFDRVKLRQALRDGPLAGLDPTRLSETASRMRAAATVLQQVAHDAACRCLTVDHGAIGMDLEVYGALQDDTRWRLLSAAICRVSGQIYRPRLKALQQCEAQALAGRRHVLGGCLLSQRRGVLWVDREPAALAGLTAPVPGAWDRRWQIDGPAMPGLHMAALGSDGLAQRPGWRKAGLRRTPLLTAPGVWDGARLVAAPSLPESIDDGALWRCRPLWDKVSACADLRSD
jgi:tRNA(Ile)-lysidine synthase